MTPLGFIGAVLRAIRSLPLLIAFYAIGWAHIRAHERRRRARRRQ